MDGMIKLGQSRMEEKKIKYHLGGKDHVLEDDIAAAVNFVLSAKDWIGEGLKFSPEASLIWVGVSAVLPFLTNPSISSKANSNGFSYVISRLRYYVALESLLFPQNIQDTNISADLRREFEQHIEELYRHILEFQLRSIIRFYRYRSGNLGRDMLKVDDWNNMVSKIKDLEDAVYKESNQINTAASLATLRGIDNSTGQMLVSMNAQLCVAEDERDMISELVQVTKATANSKTTAEERECHQLFRLVDSTGTGYEWYKNSVEKRVDGTCKWFLNHPNFKDWLEQESGLLLVTADPGCGKSVLAKFLIDAELPSQMNSRSTLPATICYFFFKDQVQSSIHQALCALLHQLFSQKPSLIRQAIASKNEDGQKLIHLPEKLWDILKMATADSEAGQVICVLDALDECDDSQRKTLTELVKTYFQMDSSRRGKLKVIMTSRPYRQITSGFQELVGLFPHMKIPGEDDSSTIGGEINAVITHRVRKLEQKEALHRGALEHLERRLMEIKHRTYLWLYLVFDYLESEPFKLTEKEIQKEIIDNVPLKVEDAYENLLKKSKYREKATKIFEILLAAYRPLTLGEMQIASEIERTLNSMTDLDMEADDRFGQRLREYCGLFVSINGGKIYFLHQTAREFLLSRVHSDPVISLDKQIWRHSISIQHAHLVLADCCMAFLKFPEWLEDIMNNSSSASEGMADHMDEHSFLEYAARYWTIHLGQASDLVSRPILDDSLELCDTQSKRFNLWFRLYWQWKHYSKRYPEFTNLMAGSYFGLEGWVRLLLARNDVEIDSKDSYSRTSLSYAAENGHEVVVKLLLEKGAEADSKNIGCDTPLSLAAERGHEAIVKLLLEKGVEVDSKDNHGQTPLSRAAENRHEAIVKLLLEKGAEVDSKDNRGQTPLSRTVQNGHEAMVKLLLEKGAEADSKDNYRQTPLLWAAERGHETIVKLLLEKGVEANLKDIDGYSPLSWATERGHEAIVKLLLEKGAEVDSKDNDGYTPLLWAADRRYRAIVKLLPENKSQ